MDKQHVVEVFLRILDSKITKTEESLVSLERQIQDAPGAMQSHSDTSKYQLGNVAQGIRERLQSMKRLRAIVQGIGTRKCRNLEHGAMFTILDLRRDHEECYFLLPEQGGDSIEVDGQEITFVSAQAPIVLAIAGRIPDDIFEFRGRRLQFVNVD